jgi:hypothetical protein
MDGVRIESERRRHERVDFSGRLFFQIAAPVDQPTDQNVPPEGGSVQPGENASAHINNVCGKGCCLTLDRPLNKFQIIKVDFPLPQVKSSIPVLAEIRWVRRDPLLNQYMVGVRYLF